VFRRANDLLLTNGIGYENGSATPFNDRGELVFGASFLDGSSGVFVTSAVAVIPEPSSFALVALGFVGVVGVVALRRRRR
jgi:hypothetical protein